MAHRTEPSRRTFDIQIDENVDFSALMLSSDVLNGLRKNGFKRPSPVQLKAIPLGKCGIDLIVQAKSGTGKTCVFTVVALEMLSEATREVQALILAPTREIAIQIQEVIKMIGCCVKGLKCHVFIGGTALEQDIKNLENCQIAVGTPGRIKSLIESKNLDTKAVRLFVMDEADKLLEPGSFQEQINWIYSTLPVSKQVLALSATYPEYLSSHLSNYMNEPLHVRINTEAPTLLGIEQYYYVVPFHHLSHVVFESKAEKLALFLSQVNFQQCLVFSNYHARAEYLAEKLSKRGWPVSVIAGKQTQEVRQNAMKRLKDFHCRVLISTDLTSRGIDCDKVDLVINLDLPWDAETYLHRIGRAGRFGNYGMALSFITPGSELKKLQGIASEIKYDIKLLKGFQLGPDDNSNEENGCLENCEENSVKNLGGLLNGENTLKDVDFNVDENTLQMNKDSSVFNNCNFLTKVKNIFANEIDAPANETNFLKNECNVPSNGSNIFANECNLGNESNALVNASNILANKNNVYANESNVLVNGSNILANESNVSANESNISANESNVVANESNIFANESNAVANESNILANGSNVLANENSVVANETHVVANESNIFANESNAVANESNVLANESNVLANESNVLANESNVLANESNVLANESNILANGSNISANESNVLANESNIVRNESNILANGSNVLANESKIVTNETHVVGNESNILANNCKDLANKRSVIGNGSTALPNKCNFLVDERNVPISCDDKHTFFPSPMSLHETADTEKGCSIDLSLCKDMERMQVIGDYQNLPSEEEFEFLLEKSVSNQIKNLSFETFCPETHCPAPSDSELHSSISQKENFCKDQDESIIVSENHANIRLDTKSCKVTQSSIPDRYTHFTPVKIFEANEQSSSAITTKDTIKTKLSSSELENIHERLINWRLVESSVRLMEEHYKSQKIYWKNEDANHKSEDHQMPGHEERLIFKEEVANAENIVEGKVGRIESLERALVDEDHLKNVCEDEERIEEEMKSRFDQADGASLKKREAVEAFGLAINESCFPVREDTVTNEKALTDEKTLAKEDGKNLRGECNQNEMKMSVLKESQVDVKILVNKNNNIRDVNDGLREDAKKGKKYGIVDEERSQNERESSIFREDSVKLRNSVAKNNHSKNSCTTDEKQVKGDNPEQFTARSLFGNCRFTSRDYFENAEFQKHSKNQDLTACASKEGSSENSNNTEVKDGYISVGNIKEPEHSSHFDEVEIKSEEDTLKSRRTRKSKPRKNQNLNGSRLPNERNYHCKISEKSEKAKISRTESRTKTFGNKNCNCQYISTGRHERFIRELYCAYTHQLNWMQYHSRNSAYFRNIYTWYETNNDK